jgi:hypothetical protein
VRCAHKPASQPYEFAVCRENIKEDYGARRARNELERQQVWQETAGREIKMQINLGQEESSFRIQYILIIILYAGHRRNTHNAKLNGADLLHAICTRA